MSETDNYYDENLFAERLKRCYDIAPPRTLQYLDAEIDYVLGKIKPDDIVLELGCGYGRVMRRLSEKARWVAGIDISFQGLQYGREFLNDYTNCLLIQMDASKLLFPDKTFDAVVCIQNGLSAFHVNQKNLIRESIRVTKPEGIVMFSSYSEKFWEHRLEWFRKQAEEGLLGEIDYNMTKGGVIVCKDGFTATTFGRKDFLSLTSELDADIQISEIDESSIFCEIFPR